MNCSARVQRKLTRSLPAARVPTPIARAVCTLLSSSMSLYDLVVTVSVECLVGWDPLHNFHRQLSCFSFFFACAYCVHSGERTPPRRAAGGSTNRTEQREAKTQEEAIKVRCDFIPQHKEFMCLLGEMLRLSGLSYATCHKIQMVNNQTIMLALLGSKTTEYYEMADGVRKRTASEVCGGNGSIQSCAGEGGETGV